MSDEPTTVYLIQCCIATDIQKVVGPYESEQTANHVAEAIERHFHNGGDRHVQVEERELIE